MWGVSQGFQGGQREPRRGRTGFAPLSLNLFNWLNADEKIGRAVYGTKLLKIPKPEFYVFYNGKEKFPERKDLKLSDAFRDFPGSEKESGQEWFGGLLELIVPVYNINRGFNEEMLKKSETLSGYAFFVDRVRTCADAGYKLEEAVPRAAEDCLERGILVDFLRTHLSEVVNMLTAEFKLEDALQVWKEEGLEEGLERGLERGREEGLERGREEGLERGREEGLERGKKEMARNLLSNGVPLDIIAKSAGLPPEEIEALAD